MSLPWPTSVFGQTVKVCSICHIFLSSFIGSPPGPFFFNVAKDAAEKHEQHD
jgi:hypothetical protein